MTTPCTLVIPRAIRDRLFGHLFPGDGGEHGAVIAAGVSRSERGVRLLARDLFVGRDGVDYVPGERGYRMLTPKFIADRAIYCRNERLCYLAVHNHGGSDRVAFSPDDTASHERGYPALLDILDGQPLGPLVFARRAAAGELWLPGGARLPITETRVVGRTIERLYPAPPPAPPGRAEAYDRQARLFGDRGQDLLAQAKVGVVGVGGVGSLLVQYLARLGVGHIVAVDPERLDVTNLPRVVGATRWDARAWMTAAERPRWLRELGARHASKKIEIARRVAKRANPQIVFEGLFGDFVDDAVARRFTDCDFVFLAADTVATRLVFNALVHQYLVPGIQVGSKVPVTRSTGEVGEVFAVSRPVTPEAGCLWCNGLIPADQLQEEAASAAERRAQRYVEDDAIAAPSVITLNALAAGAAANDFLMTYTGLTLDDASHSYLRFLPRRRAVRFDNPRQDDSCPECGTVPVSRRARGDSRALPTR